MSDKSSAVLLSFFSSFNSLFVSSSCVDRGGAAGWTRKNKTGCSVLVSVMGDTVSCVTDDAEEGSVTFSELGDDIVFSLGACISGEDEHNEMSRGQFVRLAMSEQVPGYMDKTDIDGVLSCGVVLHLSI